MKKKSNQGLDLSLSYGETITGHAKAFHNNFEKSLENVLTQQLTHFCNI